MIALRTRFGRMLQFLASGDLAIALWALCAAGALGWSLFPPQKPRHEAVHPDSEQRLVRDGRGDIVRLRSRSDEVDIFWGQGVASYLLIGRQPELTVGTRTLVDGMILHNSLLARSFPNLHSLRLLFTMRGGPLGVGPEAVAARKPAAIITIPWAADIFRTYQLPALSVSSKSGEQGVLDDTIVQAAVAGIADRGAYLNELFRTSMQTLQNETSELPKTTMIALGRDGPNVFWYSNTELSNSMYDRAKAKNLLPTRGFHRIDIEAILAVNPDVIVLRQSNYTLQTKPDDFLAEPWAASLKAVKARRVYSVPQLIAPFGNDVVQLPLFNRWLAAVLHPGEFGPSLRKLASATIRDQLGIEPTPDDLDQVLGITQNAAALPF